LEPYEFGPYRLEADPPVLWRGDAIVPLTPKAVLLLLALVRRAGQVVTHRELMAEVWPDANVHHANLSVTVAALRKALGAQADARPYVQTVSRRGYRFDAPVRGDKRPLLSLAVLPFQTIGAEADAHLGLALADAVISRLTGIKSLRVRPTGAVVAYAAQPKPPRAAAEELGVDAVIDGTIQRERERLLVSVQLVPVSRGITPWADRFEGDVGDLFGMQREASSQIASALATHLPGAGAPNLAERRPPSPAAYEAYLHARFFLARFDLDGLVRAFGHLGEACSLDPGFADARAGLAMAHLLRGFAGPEPPAQAWDVAAECAALALERDQGLGPAHVARGFVALFRDWSFANALLDIEAAAELEPGAAEPPLWLALLHSLRGDTQRAREAAARSREADVLSGIGLAVRSFVEQTLGNAAEARHLALRAIELHPHNFLGHWRLGAVALRSGRAEQALAPLARAVELTADGPAMRCIHALALARAGKGRDARRRLERLDQDAAKGWISPTLRAAAWQALGAASADVLARFERAAADKDPWLVLQSVHPTLGGPAIRPLRELRARVQGGS
jgi:DNA-binding winged helix-turn-helix (wHTH) protein/tetratricopeptide (TPR) repeat protein